MKKTCRDFLVLKHNSGIIVSFNLKLLYNKTSTERMSVASDSQNRNGLQPEKIGLRFLSEAPVLLKNDQKLIVLCFLIEWNSMILFS